MLDIPIHFGAGILYFFTNIFLIFPLVVGSLPSRIRNAVIIYMLPKKICFSEIVFDNGTPTHKPLNFKQKKTYYGIDIARI